MKNRVIAGRLLFAALFLAAGCRPVAAPAVPSAAGAQQEPELAGYAHPEDLATTAWLAEHLEDANLRIVDVRRNDVEGFLAQHIPGAVHADLVQDLMSPGAPVVAEAPPPTTFTDTMRRLGIDQNATVVVYDPAGGYMGGARLWWLLRYYGHEDVRLLNGGLAKWQQEGRPLAKGETAPPPGDFVAGAPREEWRADAAQVSRAIGDERYLIVDALPQGMFSGTVPHSEPIRAGHIPSAQNLPAPGLVDPQSTALLPYDELAAQWAALAPQPDQEALIYCEAGVFSAFDFFVLHQLGHESLRLYERSLREWGVDPSYPMTTEPGA